MQMKRTRGRPRGRHRSTADLRIIEYLVLISTKYELDVSDFFNGFVEAWKGQQSKCKNISIECRMKRKNDAVFLITNSGRVIGQFSIPKYILEETNLLKEFAHARATTRRLSSVKMKRPQIGDLKPGMNRINLKARVLEISEPRPVITKFGGATVTNANITDDTGTILLPLWNKQIFAVSTGDLIQVENARVVKFRGKCQLRIGRGGKLDVIKKT